MKAKLLTGTVYFHSGHLGKALESIQLPDGRQFLGLVRADKLVHPQRNPVIQDGDCLIAIAINPARSSSLENVLQL